MIDQYRQTTLPAHATVERFEDGGEGRDTRRLQSGPWSLGPQVRVRGRREAVGFERAAM